MGGQHPHNLGTRESRLLQVCPAPKTHSSARCKPRNRGPGAGCRSPPPARGRRTCRCRRGLPPPPPGPAGWRRGDRAVEAPSSAAPHGCGQGTLPQSRQDAERRSALPQPQPRSSIIVYSAAQLLSHESRTRRRCRHEGKVHRVFSPPFRASVFIVRDCAVFQTLKVATSAPQEGLPSDQYFGYNCLSAASCHAAERTAWSADAQRSKATPRLVSSTAAAFGCGLP